MIAQGYVAPAGYAAGSWGLEKTGAGTLTLTANNQYSGGTTISAGTLQIGDGGTSGWIEGDIVDNGVLAFNRSDDIVVDAMISGTGGLTKLGAATLTIINDMSYAGTTTISAGTLRIGNGGTIGSVAGDIVNNGTLVFDRSDDIAFAGDISGRAW